MEKEEEEKNKIIRDDNLGTVSEQKPSSVKHIHVRTTMAHFPDRMRGRMILTHSLPTI